MKLELGGGNHVRDGYTSIDLKQFTENTIVQNLECGLPRWIKEESVDHIFADNVLEHIQELLPLMNDCWRVLKYDCEFEIVVPLANTLGSLKDPTHVRQFILESFDYFDKDWDYEKKPDYGIKTWRIVSKELEGNEDYRYIRVILRKENHE